MAENLYKNGEYYADPTAAPTLQKPERGDVWENGKKEKFLIIQAHKESCSVLKLFDFGYDGEMEFLVDGKMQYASAEKVCFVANCYLTKYVKTLEKSDFAAALNDIAEVMGLPINNQCAATETEAEIAKYREKEKMYAERLVLAENRVRELESYAENMSIAANAGAEKAAKAQNKLELLQEMYDKLLQAYLDRG